MVGVVLALLLLSLILAVVFRDALMSWWRGEEVGGPPVPELGPALARYKFRGLWHLREGAGEPVGMGEGSGLGRQECNVECDEFGCTNCACPDICAGKGKSFMGLMGCDGGRIRCLCASDLSELVGEDAVGSHIPNIECARVSGGCDNRRSHIELAKWLDRLEPASSEDSYVLHNCGCKGVFDEEAPDYFEDPLHKLVCPKTSDANAVAIYEKVADLS